MSQSFKLEIVTPRRIVFNGAVVSISCPGESGRFQILYNHAPFLSALEIGKVEITEESGYALSYAISGGVSQVFYNKVLILADTAEKSKDIDLPRAEAAKTRAEERLSAQLQNLDIERAKAALHRALNRLKIAQKA